MVASFSETEQAQSLVLLQKIVLRWMILKQALLFDMDGTLIDSMPFWRNLKYEVLDYYFNRTRERIILSDEEKEKIEKLSTKKALKVINATHNSSISYKKDCYPLLEEFYSNACEIKAGVKEALEYFEENGIKMAVCTATSERLAKIALRAQGIDRYFKFILTAEKVKGGKFHTPIFRVAAMKLFKRKKNVVLIDDARYALKTARKVGVRAVWIPDGDEGENKECDLSFSDFNEMLRYFKEKGRF